jgi:beta-lactamase regulating signal transducer with metallopeptidase domain
MTSLLTNSVVVDHAQLVVWHAINSLGCGAVIAVLVALTNWALPPSASRARYFVACAALVLTVLSCVAPAADVWWIRSTPGAVWLVAIWGAGALVLLARTCGGWTVLHRLRSEPVAASNVALLARLRTRTVFTRDARLVETRRIAVPGLVGWRRPVIVLPAALGASVSDAELEAIIAHELAHVQRHDVFTNIVQTLVEDVWFFNPAVWWLSHRIRVDREYCCDQLAATLFDDPLTYPKRLVRLEQERATHTSARRVAGSSLGRRIMHLTSPSATRVSDWSIVTLFTVMTLLSLYYLRQMVPLSAQLLYVLRQLAATPTMTLGLGTVLGLLLGMRHACEPDHLLAVSTLMSTERSTIRATGLGVFWGLGHTLSLLVVGAVLALGHTQLPASAALLFEFAVSLMLVALGVRAIALAWRQGAAGPSHAHAHSTTIHQHRGALDHVHVGPLTLARRPLLVGMVHGLAGSGALTALVMANLPTAPAQLAYVVLFGCGSTIGMAALSACASWPLLRFVRQPRMVASLASVSGGLSVLYGLVSGSFILWRWGV